MSDDKTFIRRFSGIVIGLVIFTILIIVLAVSLQSPENPQDNPSKLKLAAERIAPVAAVNTGEPGTAPQAVESETATETASSGPFDGSVDGKLIYDSVCSACHNAGVADAPVPGGTMNERADKGLDALVASAIDGINIMPPRGGNPALSDEQVRAAVEFMMGQ